MRRALGIAIVLAASSAHAEPESTRLFEQGRALEAKHDYQAACERFQQSYTLEPAQGTLLHLAACAERDGDLVKAWHLFQRVVAEATTPARKDFAEAAADRLAARLVSVRITVRDPDVEDLVITTGDHHVAARRVLHEVAAPGTIVITATTPRAELFRTEVRGEAGDSLEVAIPAPVAHEAPPPARSHFWRNALIGSATVDVLAFLFYVYERVQENDAVQDIHPIPTDPSLPPRTITDADCGTGLPDYLYNQDAFDRACSASKRAKYGLVVGGIATVGVIGSVIALVLQHNRETEHAALRIVPTRTGATATLAWSW